MRTYAPANVRNNPANAVILHGIELWTDPKACIPCTNFWGRESALFARPLICLYRFSLTSSCLKLPKRCLSMNLRLSNSRAQGLQNFLSSKSDLVLRAVRYARAELTGSCLGPTIVSVSTICALW